MTSMSSPGAQNNSGNSVPPNRSSVNSGINILKNFIPVYDISPSISPSSQGIRSANAGGATVQNLGFKKEEELAMQSLL